MKNITTKISRRLIIVIVVGIFTAIFPLFIIGVDAQPPIRVGDGPEGIAYDPVNKRMYVTNIRDDTVSVINTATNTVIKSIIVGDGPIDVAYDPANKRMYVTSASAFSISVSVIDTTTNTVVGSVRVGDGPEYIAYDPVNKKMYVTNPSDGTVSPIYIWPDII